MRRRGAAAGAALVSLALLTMGSASAAPDAAQPKPLIKAWASLIQVVDALTSHVNRRQLSLIHDEDMRLYGATSELISKDQLAGMEKKDDVMLGWVVFSRQVADLHAAADAFNQVESEARLKVVLESFEGMKPRYDPAVLAAARLLADQYTCPMHFEILGRMDDACPLCGMPLDLRVRVSMFQGGGARPAPHTIRAAIWTQGVAAPGEPLQARLRLTDLEGAPIGPDALREVHTRKIHLLIIDTSLTDYHHEHPLPTEVPGEYAFSFTPRKPGPYRAWADLQPYASGFQEYAVADIPATATGEPLTDRTLTRSAQLDDLRYELTFEPADLRAGRPAAGRLRITRAADGAPFAALEPLMAAFAHLVGFNEDRETVLHMHPRGTKALEPADRGGPELEFQLYTTTPGFYRLFAQVQIGGVSRFVPFGITVAP